MVSVNPHKLSVAQFMCEEKKIIPIRWFARNKCVVCANPVLQNIKSNVVDHSYGGGQDIDIKTLSVHAHSLFTISHFAPSLSKTKSFDLWKIECHFSKDNFHQI